MEGFEGFRLLLGYGDRLGGRTFGCLKISLLQPFRNNRGEGKEGGGNCWREQEPIRRGRGAFILRFRKVTEEGG